MGKAFDHGKKTFTATELAAEPTILLQLAGDTTRNVAGTPGLVGETDPDFPLDVFLAVPPEHYYEWDPDDNSYHARFYPDEKSGSVIGANSMMGHEVYFDIENQVIGWSESSCDYSTLIEPFLSDGIPLVPPSDTEPTSQTESPKEIYPSSPGGAADESNAGTDGGDADNGYDDTDDGGSDDETDMVPSTPSEPEDPAHDKYDEPPADYGLYQPSQTMCSTIQCQISVLVGVVGVTIYCAMRFMKRQRYALTDSHELELHTTSGEFAKYDTGEFT